MTQEILTRLLIIFKKKPFYKKVKKNFHYSSGSNKEFYSQKQLDDIVKKEVINF